MQARAKAVAEARGLQYTDIATAIGRSAGAVGRALKETPAKRSPTLVDIFNYLCAEDGIAVGPQEVLQLVRQAPESAALLAAIFEEVAALLRDAAARPGRKRRPSL